MTDAPKEELDQESPQALLLEEAYQLGYFQKKDGCLIPVLEKFNKLVDTTVAEACVSELEWVRNTFPMYYLYPTNEKILNDRISTLTKEQEAQG